MGVGAGPLEEAELRGPDSLLRIRDLGSSAPALHLMGWGTGATRGSGFGTDSSVAGDVGFGEVPEELGSERSRWARGSVGAEFLMSGSPAAPQEDVQGARWIGGRTARRAWEVGGHGVGPTGGWF